MRHRPGAAHRTFAVDGNRKLKESTVENFDVVNDEVKELRGRLETERQALAKLRDRYDAACVLVVNDQEAVTEATAVAQSIVVAEARVRGLQVLTGSKEKVWQQLKDARDLAVLVETERKSAAELEVKRERLTENCRVARDRMEALKAQLPGVTSSADAAQTRYAVAENELIAYRNHRPDPLATKAEIRELKEYGARCEAAFEKAKKDRTEAFEVSSKACSALLAGADEYAHACDVLRWNCPPKPEDRGAGKFMAASGVSAVN